MATVAEKDNSTIDLLHESKFTPVQCLILILSMIACMVEGFDVVVIAYTSPAIIADWSISAQEMGWILSAGIFGMTIGAMLLSWLGDKYGRCIVTSATLIITGIATSLVFFAETVAQLILLRIIAGLALGVMMATLSPLVGEYSPKKYRTQILSILLAGAALGSVAGGFISAALIENFGWQSIFLYTGILTGVLGILMMFLVPESLHFIVHRQSQNTLEKVNHALAYIGQDKIDRLPNLPGPEKREPTTVFSLFTPSRKKTTLLCWTAFFFAFVAMYFITSWLPQILVNAGYTQERAIQATAILPMGGIFGTLIVGWSSRRWSLNWLIGAALMSGALCIFILSGILRGVEDVPFQLITVILFCVGITFFGGYTNLYTITILVYPTQIRSTALGWAAGLGRFGAVISPTLAGMMLDWGVSVPNMFFYFSIPIVVSATCVVFIKMQELT